MATRPLRHIPMIDFIAIVANKSDGSRACKVAIEHVSRRDFLVIDASQADSLTEESVLLHDKRIGLRRGSFESSVA